MVWYKFWKRSGPMQGLSQEYFWFESEMSKESLKFRCESWADSIGGGHNTYYRYGFERVDHPPVGELETMIRIEKEEIENQKKQLGILYETLNDIKIGVETIQNGNSR